LKEREPGSNRRKFLRQSAALATAWLLPSLSNSDAAGIAIEKTIPSSGERLPVIGMGTSRTFNAAGDAAAMAALTGVLEAFFAHGGSLVDSSPMYGSSEQVLGQLLPAVSKPRGLFAATKVWTDGRESGVRQMEQSRRLWGIERFDLMQIHNLRDWRAHYETLREMKAAGQIRYIGITTSHGRDHAELRQLLEKHDFDFVQFSYNIANREAERVLLPLAAERGVAVIVNRPFARGGLFRTVKRQAMPEWAAEFDCTSWGQFFLKYTISHPAVTCAIPATSKVRHMLDNMGAGFGRLPDTAMRQRMAAFIASL
jgi:diketogulonate reductase-like aldo/keto reductase